MIADDVQPITNLIPERPSSRERVAALGFWREVGPVREVVTSQLADTDVGRSVKETLEVVI